VLTRPSKLTAAQKEKISELDSLYKAKRAEKELFLKGEIAKAQDAETYEQLSRELKRLEDDCEEKKEKVRAGKT
jgi:cell shape-determining protein MreC